MSEPHNKIVRHLAEFAFFKPESLGSAVEYPHMGDFLGPSNQDGLEGLVSEIVRKTLDEEPSIVVVDSAKMLGDFADKRELRRALYDLTSRFSRTGTVLLLLGEYAPEELRSDVVFSLADGIIQLEYEAREPIDRRWLRVIKMRGRSHLSGKHTFRIGPGGVEVFPRVETLVPDPEAPLSGQVPSGISGLDDLMGGGARQGDASLVTGPSGVGKTIFGLRWLVEAMNRGENCLYVTFKASGAQLTSVAAGFHWDLAAYRDSGQDRFAAYMRSLVGLIRAGGSSLLLTSETSVRGLPGNSLDGLMFLFDNTIDLRYIEDESQIVRAVHVAKMRSRAHSMSLNSLTITDRGLEVGHALDRVTGRLGWSALRTQGPAEPARPAAPAADAWPTGPEAPGHRARVASPRGAGQE
jgi:circadian clock protein KaiC